jgi:ribosome-binding protein aMBF1 (putative translation factor)
MDHQNWKPQIINKFNKQPTEKKPLPKKNGGKEKKLDMDDNPKTKKMDSKLCKLIREKRIIMGFNSQKEFAKELNLNINDIKDCETVGSVYKPQTLSKIKRRLKINKTNTD